LHHVIDNWQLAIDN